jgi:hypothetical protein
LYRWIPAAVVIAVPPLHAAAERHSDAQPDRFKLCRAIRRVAALKGKDPEALPYGARAFRARFHIGQV